MLEQIDKSPGKKGIAQLSAQLDDISADFLPFKKGEDWSKRGQRAHRALAFQLLYMLDRSSYQVQPEEIIFCHEDYFEITIPLTCFAVSIVRGVLGRAEDLEGRIKPLLQNWDYERISCTSRILLKMASWELFFDPCTPSKTVIDEYVELSKTFGEPEGYRLINGILDKMAEKANSILLSA